METETSTALIEQQPAQTSQAIEAAESSSFKTANSVKSDTSAATAASVEEYIDAEWLKTYVRTKLIGELATSVRRVQRFTTNGNGAEAKSSLKMAEVINAYYLQPAMFYNHCKGIYTWKMPLASPPGYRRYQHQCLFNDREIQWRNLGAEKVHIYEALYGAFVTKRPLTFEREVMLYLDILVADIKIDKKLVMLVLHDLTADRKAMMNAPDVNQLVEKLKCPESDKITIAHLAEYLISSDVVQKRADGLLRGPNEDTISMRSAADIFSSRFRKDEYLEDIAWITRAFLETDCKTDEMVELLKQLINGNDLRNEKERQLYEDMCNAWQGMLQTPPSNPQRTRALQRLQDGQASGDTLKRAELKKIIAAVDNPDRELDETANDVSVSMHTDEDTWSAVSSK